MNDLTHFTPVLIRTADDVSSVVLEGPSRKEVEAYLVDSPPLTARGEVLTLVTPYGTSVWISAHALIHRPRWSWVRSTPKPSRLDFRLMVQARNA